MPLVLPNVRAWKLPIFVLYNLSSCLTSTYRMQASKQCHIDIFSLSLFFFFFSEMPHFHRICFSAMAFSVYCFLVLFLSMWQLWHFSAANWSFFGKVQSLCDELVTTLNWCTTAETVDKIWYDVIYYQVWLLQSVWTMWMILSKGFMIVWIRAPNI